jgi:hypothetical protein
VSSALTRLSWMPECESTRDRESRTMRGGFVGSLEHLSLLDINEMDQLRLHSTKEVSNGLAT